MVSKWMMDVDGGYYMLLLVKMVTSLEGSLFGGRRAASMAKVVRFSCETVTVQVETCACMCVHVLGRKWSCP